MWLAASTSELSDDILHLILLLSPLLFSLPFYPIISRSYHEPRSHLKKSSLEEFLILCDQMAYHQNANDFIMVAVLHDEIKQLTAHMKDDDYDFLLRKRPTPPRHSDSIYQLHSCDPKTLEQKSERPM